MVYLIYMVPNRLNHLTSHLNPPIQIAQSLTPLNSPSPSPSQPPPSISNPHQTLPTKPSPLASNNPLPTPTRTHLSRPAPTNLPRPPPLNPTNLPPKLPPLLRRPRHLRRLIHPLRRRWRNNRRSGRRFLRTSGGTRRRIFQFRRHFDVKRFQWRIVAGFIALLEGLLWWLRWYRVRRRDYGLLRSALSVLRAGRETFLGVRGARSTGPLGIFLEWGAGRRRRGRRRAHGGRRWLCACGRFDFGAWTGGSSGAEVRFGFGRAFLGSLGRGLFGCGGGSGGGFGIGVGSEEGRFCGGGFLAAGGVGVREGGGVV